MSFTLPRLPLYPLPLLFALLAAFGCGGSDPIVVIALHPSKPRIIYIATNDYILEF